MQSGRAWLSCNDEQARQFTGASLACVALLAVLSLTPGDYMVRTGVSQQLEHFVAYLGTGAVASVGYGRRVSALQITGLLCGYAAFLEIGQIWVPGRHSQFIDFAVSAAGVAAGVVLIRLWIGRQAPG
jgi:VanZ family protein